MPHADPEVAKAYFKEYGQEHRDRIRARQREYARRPEVIAKRRAQARLTDEEKAAKRQRYHERQARMVEHRKKWDEDHPGVEYNVEKAWKERHALTSAERSLAHYYRRRELINNRRRERRTGATPEVYAALLEKQGGRCAICGRDPGKRVLQADHCHKTKKVRGLLCYRCNPALGLFGDSPDLVLRAAEYLREHR